MWVTISPTRGGGTERVRWWVICAREGGAELDALHGLLEVKMTKSLGTYLAGVLIVLLTTDLCGGQEVSSLSGVLEVGYSRNLFYNVDMNDARAATKVWVKGLIDKTGELAESRSVVLDDLDATVRGVNARELDLLVLLSSEYLRIKDKIRQEVSLVPMASAVSGGEIEQRYVLLTHRNSGLERLNQLRGKTLIQAIAGKGSIPRMWMDVLLWRSGLDAGETFFEEIREVSKVSQAVLPVFFGQGEACVTPLDAFHTMTELNPQLAEELRIIETSPGFCQVVVCGRKDVYESTLNRYLEESILSLGNDPDGQQLLMLFHVDRLVPFDPVYLESVAELMEEYERLSAERGE